MNIDEKKRVKDFIDYIFNWAAHEYIAKGHNAFIYEIRDDNKLAYMIADKGIEKRLQKLFKKKMLLSTTVEYTTEKTKHKYCDGKLKITINYN